jgi:hypothetical protein
MTGGPAGSPREEGGPGGRGRAPQPSLVKSAVTSHDVRDMRHSTWSTPCRGS